MAEKLTFILEFDQKTGGLKVVETGLKKVEKAAKSAGKAAQGTGSSLKGIGNIVGAIGIGAFLLSTVRSAAAGSDSMNELNETWKATVGIITETLEPAIALVSRGLQGLMVTVQGLAKVFKDLAAGEFKAAWNSILDTIQAGGDRAAGITKQIERVQSKIILEEGKIRLADLTLTGNQKLEIIAEIEREALRLLRESGEFQTSDKKRRAKAELEILKELSTERESAEMEARAQEQMNLQAAFAAEQELTNINIEDQNLTFEERIENLRKFHLNERIQIQKQGDQKRLDQATIDKQIAIAAVKALDRRNKLLALQIKFEAKVAAKTRADALGLTVAQQTKIEQITLQHVNILLRFAAEGEGSIRDVLKGAAAESIKLVAQTASSKIAAYAVDASWAALAAPPGPPFTIPIAAGILAAGTAAAASVAALGGVAARRITGAPDLAAAVPIASPLTEPIPVTGVPSPVSAGGFAGSPSGFEEAIELGEPPGGGGAIPVQVSVLVLGDLSDEAAEKIGEAVGEAVD